MVVSVGGANYSPPFVYVAVDLYGFGVFILRRDAVDHQRFQVEIHLAGDALQINRQPSILELVCCDFSYYGKLVCLSVELMVAEHVAEILRPLSPFGIYVGVLEHIVGCVVDVVVE